MGTYHVDEYWECVLGMKYWMLNQSWWIFRLWISIGIFIPRIESYIIFLWTLNLILVATGDACTVCMESKRLSHSWSLLMTPLSRPIHHIWNHLGSMMEYYLCFKQKITLHDCLEFYHPGNFSFMHSCGLLSHHGDRENFIKTDGHWYDSFCCEIFPLSGGLTFPPRVKASSFVFVDDMTTYQDSHTISVHTVYS
jgi:hypothetical protein